MARDRKQRVRYSATEALTSRYDVDNESARRDAQKFIDSLDREGIIEEGRICNTLSFHSVRSGLWGTPADRQLFRSVSPDDWETVYRMANSQALLALTFDGISSLPAELRPPRALYLKWAARTAQIEQANKRLNQLLPELNTLYREAGLHPVLLKGARHRHQLPHSLAPAMRRHRHLFRKTRTTHSQPPPAATRRHSRGRTSDKHASYSLKGVHIENHRIILRLNSPLANRHFQQIIRKWYPQETDYALFSETGKEDSKAVSIAIPPATFNALYIFLHAFVHFLNSGIGLRQLCDWTCLLANRHKEIDATTLLRQLQDLGLLHAAQAFGYIAVTRLGLPANRLPFPLEGTKQIGEQLLEDILSTGNFGQHDNRIKPRPKGYWAGKWYTFCRATRRCNELRQFAPYEALWYPRDSDRGNDSYTNKPIKRSKRQESKDKEIKEPGK